MKRDDQFDEDDVETDETRRLSGNLSKSAESCERDTPQQPQASGVSNQSTLGALKELEEPAHLSSRAGIFFLLWL